MRQRLMPITAAAGRPRRWATRVQGVAPPTTPILAAVVIYVPIRIPVRTSSHSNWYPWLAPILALINRLPGPNTTQAVINAGPIDRHQERRCLDSEALVGSVINYLSVVSVCCKCIWYSLIKRLGNLYQMRRGYASFWIKAEQIVGRSNPYVVALIHYRCSAVRLPL